MVPSDSMSRQFLPIGSMIPETRCSSNTSLSSSEEDNLVIKKGKRELEKRRRANMLEDENLNDAAGIQILLNLGLKILFLHWLGVFFGSIGLCFRWLLLPIFGLFLMFRRREKEKHS